ncbi:hypothetical protein ACT3R9_03590, partial [Psychrobacter sp. AOP42-A1-21]
GYAASDKDNSNIFAPATKPLRNFELFSFSLGDEETISVSGSRSLIGEDIKLKNDGSNGAIIEIKVSSDNLPAIRRIFE